MSIQRLKSHSKDFVILFKGVINDKNLSLKAVGLWTYLMGLPDDWQINARDLAQRHKDGYESVLSALKELAENGYAIKTQGKDQNRSRGKFTHGGWIVYEEKQAVTVKGNPKTVKPQSVKPQSVEPELLSIEEPSIELEEKEYKEKKEMGVAPRTPPSPSVQDITSSSGKRKTEFSSSVKSLANSLTTAMEEANSDYTRPVKMDKIYKSIDLMLNHDKRQADNIIQMYKWVLRDEFWCSKIYTANPADYLRKHYARFSKNMTVVKQKKTLSKNDTDANARNCFYNKERIEAKGMFKCEKQGLVYVDSGATLGYDDYDFIVITKKLKVFE